MITARFCRCHILSSPLKPKVYNSYYSGQQNHQCTRVGIIIKCFVKTSLRILIVLGVFMFLGYVVPSKIVTVFIQTIRVNETFSSYFHTAKMNPYESAKFRQNGNFAIFGQQIQDYDHYSGQRTTTAGAEVLTEIPELIKMRKKHDGKKRIISFDHIEENKKFWMRISDDVFVYSAHIDVRNFTTLHPTLNNISPGMPDGRVKNDGKGEQRAGKNDNDDDDDSDKLKHAILVRIVGMKAIPSLREFIKTDILDWFRIKNEMEYSQKYKCNLFYTAPTGTSLQNISSSRVTYTVVEEGVKIYASTYFNCYFAVTPLVYQSIKLSALSNNLKVAMYPTLVSDYPTKLIDVGSSMIGSEKNKSNNDINFRRRSLSICVRPLFGPFDDLEKLIQFIGYYHVMGITRFNFYSMSVSPRVRKYILGVMAMMREASIEERKILPRFILHDWNVPTGNTSELWDYGTLAALNDCLFSNVDQEFVIFVDVDEFIVPQGNRSNNNDDHRIPNLWTIIDSYNITSTYQYLIRNTFFCHEFCAEMGNDTTSPKNNSISLPVPNMQPPLTTDTQKSEITPIFTTPFPVSKSPAESLTDQHLFRCFQRTKRVWNAALRSKFIVNPRQVLAVGHHLTTKYVEKIDFRFSGHSVQVDPSIGILNHYRECTSISSKKHPVLTRVRQTDKTIINFRKEVIDVLSRYYSLQSVI